MTKETFLKILKSNKDFFNGISFSIEGCDGSGKGLLLSKIMELFSEAEIDVVSTREPGGVPISESIRNIIVDKNNTNMDSKTEALLYIAARNQHLVEKVIPLLKQKKCVILDRFIDSTYVYQGIARGLGIEKMIELNEFVLDGFNVKKTIYLDIDPEVSLKRIASNNRETNRLDLESLNFHQKVREGYLYLANEKFQNRISVVNADQTPEAVLEDALDVIAGMIQ